MNSIRQKPNHRSNTGTPHRPIRLIIYVVGNHRITVSIRCNAEANEGQIASTSETSSTILYCLQFVHLQSVSI